MIRTLIADDEAKGRSILKTLLTRYCTGIEIVAEAQNVTETKLLLNSIQPDLLFLDISMPDGNGFDVLDTVSHSFEIIFTTAYNEYTLQAIRNNAVDYLLKPLNIGELQQAVARAAQRIGEKKTFRLLETVQGTIAPDNGTGKKIAVPVADGLEFVPVDDIIQLTARGSYTNIFCKGKLSLLSSRPLKDFEHLLPAAVFFRVHHSSIINLSCVKHYHRGNGGYVTMTDGSIVDISKRKKKEFLDLFAAGI